MDRWHTLNLLGVIIGLVGMVILIIWSHSIIGAALVIGGLIIALTPIIRDMILEETEASHKR